MDLKKRELVDQFLQEELIFLNPNDYIKYTSWQIEIEKIKSIDPTSY